MSETKQTAEEFIEENTISVGDTDYKFIDIKNVYKLIEIVKRETVKEIRKAYDIQYQANFVPSDKAAEAINKARVEERERIIAILELFAKTTDEPLKRYAYEYAIDYLTSNQ